MIDVKDSRNDGGLPCGLYVHIPFCETKCGYCDFYSVPLKDRVTRTLVNSICREIGRRAASCPYTINTVFLGGGTPTLLPPDELGNLLQAVANVVPIDELEECTVEANPATVSHEVADLLVRAGVGRVSMGAQSFFAAELATLERLHSPDDIRPSVEVLRGQGIKQINLDLIFGIPGQTLDTWSASLDRALELDVDHIATYGLTFEPATKLTAQLASGRVTRCDEYLEADMYLLAIEKLSKAGLEQYEISNFAKPGCRCRHNLTYWRNQPYVGVGPSAAGCVRRRRYKNIPDVAGYVRMMNDQGHAETETEQLDEAAICTEMIMMQLRLVEGLSRISFSEEVGVDPVQAFGQVLPGLREANLMSVSDSHIFLTPSGRMVADAVIRQMVSDCDLGSAEGRASGMDATECVGTTTM